MQTDYYRPHLLTVALRLLPEPADAEDLVQDTILSLIEQGSEVTKQYATYRLYSRWTDRMRHEGTLPEISGFVDDFNSDGGEDPETLMLRAEQIATLRRELSEEQFELLMDYANGLSLAEIGRRDGVSDSTLRTRLRRALRTARAALA